MGTIWVKEFTGGLDTRRLPVATTGGVLVKAVNGHVSRGGEFEKRAAFVRKTTAAGTVGLVDGIDGLYTFASTARPSNLDPTLKFQRLVHATSSAALSRILCAELYDGLLYVVAQFADGQVYHYYDGERVVDEFDGKAKAKFKILKGDDNDGENPSRLSQITVAKRIDGAISKTPLLAAPIEWETDAQDMATRVADAINAQSGVHGFTATAFNRIVSVAYATDGAAANRWWLTCRKRYGLALEKDGYAEFEGGKTLPPVRVIGKFAKTADLKIYTPAGSALYFSGISEPTRFTTDFVGAGFIDMGASTAQGGDLTSIARYQSNLAVFARKTIIIEYIDPDPALNRVVKILNNTGTDCPRSVTEFGDADVFYLDQSGLRSLQARTNTDSAATSDIGVPVDAEISDKLATLTEMERLHVFGLIEPHTGNFWLIMKDIIYVFAFYQGAKISAWTTYRPSMFLDEVEREFSVDYATVHNNRVWLRSGDDIIVYGGESGAFTYDRTEAVAWLPHLDANSPTQGKDWGGIDAAVQGVWSISASLDPNETDASDEIAVITKTTYPEHRIPNIGHSTHLSPRFRTTDPTSAKLSAVVVHFIGDDLADN